MKVKVSRVQLPSVLFRKRERRTKAKKKAMIREKLEKRGIVIENSTNNSKSWSL